jgi:hypothetical protein
VGVHRLKEEVKMKYEVVEKATGARMSHRAKGGDIMGTTLFDSAMEALTWWRDQGLEATHEVKEAHGRIKA